MPDWQAMGSERTKHQPVYTSRGAGAPPTTPASTSIQEEASHHPAILSAMSPGGGRKRARSGEGTDVWQVLP